MKRLLSIILTVTILLSTVIIVMPVINAVPEGYTAIEDFDALAAGGKYYLTKDITIEGRKSIGSDVILDGGGHTVTYTGTQALFGWSKNVVIKNLNMVGTIEAEGNNVYNDGILTNGFDGNATIENCTFDVDYTFNGTINYLGGVIAKNQDGGGTTTIKNVVNKGDITVNGAVFGGLGGIFGWAGTGTNTIDGCVYEGTIKVTGDANNGAYIGGIVGTATKSTTITNSINKGTIELGKTKINNNNGVGGIIGMVDSHQNSATKIYVNNSANLGDIIVGKDAPATHTGGIIGKVCAVSFTEVKDCINKGNITANATSGWCGTAGIVGTIMTIKKDASWWWSDVEGGDFDIINCHNFGDVTGMDAAGILGTGRQLFNDTITIDITNCSNSGKINGLAELAGGIAALLSTSDGNGATITIAGCYNNADVTNVNEVGGIVGSIQTPKAVEIKNCASAGTLTAGKDKKADSVIAYCGVTATITDCGEGAEAVQAADDAIVKYNKDNATALIFSEAQWNAKGDKGAGKTFYIARDLEITTASQNFSDGKINGLGNTVTFSGAANGLVNWGANVTVKDINLAGAIKIPYGSNGGAVSQHGIHGVSRVENVNSSTDITITAGNGGGHIGGILGKTDWDANVTLINVHNTGDVIVEPNLLGAVGGIVGCVQGKFYMENCSSTGNVVANITDSSGDHNGVGGIIGIINTDNREDVTTITNVSTGADASITINATGAFKDLHVGGLVGRVYKARYFTITNSVNNADVKSIADGNNGWECVGGIVGGYMTPNNNVANCVIENCVNNGDVTGEDNAGGILGGVKQLQTNTAVRITNCINTGAVNGWHFAGGIVGQVADSTSAFGNIIISNSVNAGTVTAVCTDWAKAAGGIMGFYSGNGTGAKIENCVNAGTVKTVAEAYRAADSWVRAAGILGDYNGTILLVNNIHMGTVATKDGEGVYSSHPITSASETRHNSAATDAAWFAGKLLGGEYDSYDKLGNIYLVGTAPQAAENNKLSSEATYATVAAKLTELGVPGVTTKLLEDTIAAKDDLTETDYITSTWAAYAAAVATAEATLAGFEADGYKQADVVTAAGLVAEAKANLVTKANFYAELNAAIASIDDLSAANYSVATWNNLLEKVAAAKAALPETPDAVGNEDAEEIAALIASINKATSALVDVTDIKKSISEAESLVKSEYLTSSWDAMIEKLDAAKAAVENATTAKEIADAKAALDAAKTVGEGGLIPSNVDELLANSLVKAEDVYATGTVLYSTTLVIYSVPTWNTFTAALEAAQAIDLENPETTPEFVISVVNALDKSMANLEKISMAALKEALDTKVTDIAGEYYTEETWAAYDVAYATAALTLNGAASQGAVDGAVMALNEAFAALKLQTIEKDELAVIEEFLYYYYDTINPAHFDEEAWAEFEAAVEELREISINTTAYDFDRLNTLVEEAMTKLEENIVPGYAYDGLPELYDKYYEIGDLLWDRNSNYVNLHIIREALGQVEAILAPYWWWDEASPAEIDACIEILDGVKDLLVTELEPETVTIQDQIRALYETLSDEDKIAVQMLVKTDIDLNTLLKLLTAMTGGDILPPAEDEGGEGGEGGAGDVIVVENGYKVTDYSNATYQLTIEAGSVANLAFEDWMIENPGLEITATWDNENVTTTFTGHELDSIENGGSFTLSYDNYSFYLNFWNDTDADIVLTITLTWVDLAA